MVKQGPRWLYYAAAGAALVLVTYALMPTDAPVPGRPVRASERTRPGPAEAPLPVIGFARVTNPQPAPALGSRDLFDFATPPPTLAPAPPPPAVVAEREEITPVTVPTPPPMNIKYIGAVERKGVKVAMLMTERSEVLTGQAGDMVGNRFRIVKIGLESVDIQEVGSEQVRRIPLKGN